MVGKVTFSGFITYIYGVELIVVESYTTYVIILVITNPHPIDYIYICIMVHPIKAVKKVGH
jgi:hypothetical protein